MVNPLEPMYDFLVQLYFVLPSPFMSFINLVFVVGFVLLLVHTRSTD